MPSQLVAEKRLLFTAGVRVEDIRTEMSAPTQLILEQI